MQNADPENCWNPDPEGPNPEQSRNPDQEMFWNPDPVQPYFLD
jgi:hypothetical protein